MSTGAQPGRLITLMRKELRRQRSLLVGGAVIIGLAYVLVVVPSIADQRPSEKFRLADCLFSAGAVGVVLSCVLCSFFAGNAVAGERPTRSIEFMEYLPVPRGLDWLSRLGIAAGLTLALLVPNGLLCLYATVQRGGWHELVTREAREALEICAFVTCTAMGVFGVSWLLSTLLRSPVVATAGGVLLMLTLMILGSAHAHYAAESTPFSRLYWSQIFPILSGSLGLAGIVLGSFYHLRRRTLRAESAVDWRGALHVSPELRVLIRKELRRQRGVLIGAGCLFLLPYLASLLFVASLQPAIGAGLLVGCVMAGFFAGNGVAGERPPRTLEFLAGLPIPRRLDLISRLAVAMGLSLAFVMLSGWIFVWGAILAGLGEMSWDQCFMALIPVAYGAGVAMGIFGIAWFVATRASSAVISCACGLLAVLMFFAVGLQLSFFGHPGHPSEVYWRWILPIAVGVLALAGIVGGSWYHLRRRVLE